MLPLISIFRITRNGDIIIIPRKMRLRLMSNLSNKIPPGERILPDMTRNCQKKPNMVPIDPRSSPKANGSLIPFVCVILLKNFLGEKRTRLEVWYIPFQIPRSDPFSQGEDVFGFIRWNSNLCSQRGQIAHLTPEGIFSLGTFLEKSQYGHLISTVIFFFFSSPQPHG